MIQLTLLIPVTAIILSILTIGYLTLKLDVKSEFLKRSECGGRYSHTFQNLICKVENFNLAFGFPVAEEPTLLKPEIYELCYNLMKEENEEYLEACKNKDMIEISDALGDQLFVLIGTMIKHGLQDKIEKIFDEIYLSNMSKLDKNGQPIYNAEGKAMKSSQYFKPNLEQFFI